MIRDPSDGSVREPPKAEVGIPTTKSDLQIHRPESETGISVSVPSGLRAPSTRPQMIAKLEKSRQWLKNYHERKGTK